MNPIIRAFIFHTIPYYLGLVAAYALCCIAFYFWLRRHRRP